MHTIEDELTSLAGNKHVTRRFALILGEKMLLYMILLLAWHTARGEEVLVQRGGVLYFTAVRGERFDAGLSSQIPKLQRVVNVARQTLRKLYSQLGNLKLCVLIELGVWVHSPSACTPVSPARPPFPIARA